MPSIKKNIVANFVGKVWSAVIGILLIPLYIKYLGIESYGLIGFYSTLLGSMAVLDLGLSTTLNRELAKYKSENRTAKNIRDLTFSLECIYWCMGFLICLLVILISPLIATHWVKAEHLPIIVVKQSVMLMAAVLAFQWPISLYSGGLTGLEKQVLNNIITVVMTTLRAAGVIIILRYFSNTVESFFIFQAVVSFLYVALMRWALWKSMPLFQFKPAFSKQQLKTIWRFAAGMTGISFVTFFLSQIDKIVLSKLLTLSQFGYYTLAFTMSSSIRLIAGPVSMSFFPRFTNLAAKDDEYELKILYHKACELMASFIFPLYFTLLFFSRDILLIWTHNNITAENSYILAEILIIGSILNSLMILPYQLIIANGWTKFTFYQNTIASIILVPLLFWLTSVYGVQGAAWVWVCLNLGLVFISQSLMHRKLLKNELMHWYIYDTLLPMLPSLLTIFLIKFTLQHFFPDLHIDLFLLAVIGFVTFAVSILNIKSAREMIRKTLRIKVQMEKQLK